MWTPRWLRLGPGLAGGGRTVASYCHPFAAPRASSERSEGSGGGGSLPVGGGPAGDVILRSVQDDSQLLTASPRHRRIRRIITARPGTCARRDCYDQRRRASGGAINIWETRCPPTAGAPASTSGGPLPTCCWSTRPA